MDYTPVILGDSPGKAPRQTTNPHELATSVVFESGLQHFTDSVTGYLAAPDYVQKFLRTVPVTWDETRLLDGIPGEMILLARRKGNDWYVAGLNGGTAPRTVSVPLGFLGRGTYQANVISDAQTPRSFAQRTESVRRGGPLTVTMAGRGGFVARLSKE
jgi:hypothetical protein